MGEARVLVLLMLLALQVVNCAVSVYRDGPTTSNAGGVIPFGQGSSGYPSARAGAAQWIDTSGNLWIFGGEGIAAGGGGATDLASMWKYEKATNQWLLISGNLGGNVHPTYPQFEGQTGSPGARENAATWVDSLGALWLFGGYGISGSTDFKPAYLNDLWKYNVSTASWSWMGGNQRGNATGTYPTAVGGTGVPGGRHYAAYWTDVYNGLWVYGGQGIDESGKIGLLSDLWRYANGNWMYVAGNSTVNIPATYPTNAGDKGVPPALFGGAFAFSKNRLYLVGGMGLNGPLSDVWEFVTNPSAQTFGYWNWLSGTKLPFASAIYPLNYNESGSISARVFASLSALSTGELILFGGSGCGLGSCFSSSDFGDLNDLWSFNIPSRLWRWIGGSRYLDSPAVFPSSTCQIGTVTPRSRAGTWVDTQDTIWIFGGASNMDSSSVSFYSDFWTIKLYNYKYVSAIWKNGASQINQNPQFPASIYQPGVPGAVHGPVRWVSPENTLYMFGGFGYYKDSLSPFYIAAFWMYNKSTNLWYWQGGSQQSNDVPTYPTGVPGSGMPGARMQSQAWTDTITGNQYMFGGYGRPDQRSTLTLGWIGDMWMYNHTSQAGSWYYFGGNINGSNPSMYPPTVGEIGIPGARYLGVTWMQDDKVFMYGGFGDDQTSYSIPLGDMWWFNRTTFQWTYMGGARAGNGQVSTAIYPSAVGGYGYPGARYAAAYAQDYQTGEVWVYGGKTTKEGARVILADLWVFNSNTQEWRFMGGQRPDTFTFPSYPASAGQQGTPGGRYEAALWISGSRIILYGGDSYADSSQTTTYGLGDFWLYDARNVSNTFYWLGEKRANATYVTGGCGSTPGPRSAFAYWTDRDGDMWLYGGTINQTDIPNRYRMSDMWRITVDSSFIDPPEAPTPAPTPSPTPSPLPTTTGACSNCTTSSSQTTTQTTAQSTSQTTTQTTSQTTAPASSTSLSTGNSTTPTTTTKSSTSLPSSSSATSSNPTTSNPTSSPSSSTTASSDNESSASSLFVSMFVVLCFAILL